MFKVNNGLVPHYNQNYFTQFLKGVTSEMLTSTSLVLEQYITVNTHCVFSDPSYVES